MEQQPSKRIYFKNLDALRYIAFFLVFFSHAVLAPINTRVKNGQNETAKFIVESMDLSAHALSIFFVLSGFLITYIILQEIKLKGKLHLVYFYIRRILRIWPLYFLVIFFGFFIYPKLMLLSNGNTDPCGQLWMYLVFINNFDFLQLNLDGLNCFNPFIFTTWSIAVEEQFYFFWPLLFIFIPRRFQHAIFPVILIGCFIFRYLHSESWDLLYYHTIAILGDFAIGGWAAYIAVNRQDKLKFIKQRTYIQRLLVYLSLPILLYARHLIFPWDMDEAFIRFIFIAYFAYIILDQNFHDDDRLKLSNIKLFDKWGKYTYGMYLLSPVAVMFTIKVLWKISFIKSNPILLLSGIFLISLSLTKLLGYISFHYFESYFLGLKKRFSFIKRD